MHLVHRNSKYPDVTSALGKLDGLAVFAVFFEIDPYKGKDDWILDFKEYPMMTKVGNEGTFLMSRRKLRKLIAFN